MTNENECRAEHYGQMILEEREIIRIMEESFINENLALCIMVGTRLPPNAQRLMLCCVKFSLISSLFCPGADGKLTKPAREHYERLFDDYIESPEEASERMWDFGLVPEYDTADVLYEKYTLLKEALVPMLADTEELCFASEIRDAITKVLDGKPADSRPCDIKYGNWRR